MRQQAQGDPGLREVALITIAVTSKVAPLVACLLNTPGDSGQMVRLGVSAVSI